LQEPEDEVLKMGERRGESESGLRRERARGSRSLSLLTHDGLGHDPLDAGLLGLHGCEVPLTERVWEREPAPGEEEEREEE
jgi:hypothetical protein